VVYARSKFIKYIFLCTVSTLFCTLDESAIPSWFSDTIFYWSIFSDILQLFHEILTRYLNFLSDFFSLIFVRVSVKVIQNFTNLHLYIICLFIKQKAFYPITMLKMTTPSPLPNLFSFFLFYTTLGKHFLDITFTHNSVSSFFFLYYCNKYCSWKEFAVNIVSNSLQKPIKCSRISNMILSGRYMNFMIKKNDSTKEHFTPVAIRVFL